MRVKLGHQINSIPVLPSHLLRNARTAATSFFSTRCLFIQVSVGSFPTSAPNLSHVSNKNEKRKP